MTENNPRVAVQRVQNPSEEKGGGGWLVRRHGDVGVKEGRRMKREREKERVYTAESRNSFMENSRFFISVPRFPLRHAGG